MNNYWVGFVSNPGHPFATYVVGEYVNEDEKEYMIVNPVRVMEMPNQQGGMAYNFIPDEFFTTPTPVKLGKEKFLMAKIMDPAIDAKMCAQLEATYARVRMNKAGLVSAQPQQQAPQLGAFHK